MQDTLQSAPPPLTDLKCGYEPTSNQRPVTDNSSLELDGERTVTFKDRGHAYTYHLSRITGRDWSEYFDGTAVSTRNEGKNGTLKTIDIFSAAIALVEKKVVKVDGYDGDFMQNAEWKKYLPFGHARLAGVLLLDAGVAESDAERPLNPMKIEVELNAKWNANPSNSGMMEQYSGLIHRFNPPTAEHKRKFNRASSSSRLVGAGGRTGATTLYPSRQRLLVEFYDDLIASVDGYALRGQPLSSPEQIRAEMDGWHKVAAAQQLFASPVDEDASGE